MSKELEAFNRILREEIYDTGCRTIKDCCEEDCNIINQALQRLEEIEKANPSEDLKTIDEIRTKHTKYHTNGIASGTIEMDQDYFFSLIHIAKSNVEKLKQIEEAKKISPNERALDCLQILKVMHNLNAQEFPKSYEYCNIIKDALTYKSKKELAFDIIFEKNVDIQLLKESEDRSEYNVHFPYREMYHLTQEEFKLLKEVIR